MRGSPGPSPRRAAGRRALSPRGDGPALTGRDTELAALRDLLSRLQEGRGSTALVIGPAGVGKSALVGSFLAEARAQGHQISSAIVDPMDPRPLGAVVDAFRDQSDVASLISRLEETAGPDTVSSALDPVLDGLERRKDEVGRVLVIEDLHAGPPELVTFLTLLLDRLPVTGAMLIATSRPSRENESIAGLATGAERTGHLIHVRDLEPSAQHALVTRLLGGQPGPRLLQVLTAVGGNPLHLIELLRDLRREEALERDGTAIEVTTASLPRPLRRTVEARLEAATSGARAFIETASVLGTSFVAGDVARVIGTSLPEVIPFVREGVRLNLFSSDEPLRFPHDLLRDAVYEQVPPGIRHELHAEISMKAAQAGHMDVALGHLRLAPSRLDPEIASQLITHVLEAAQTAPATCAEVLEEVLKTSPVTSHDRYDTALELARMKIWSGHPSEAVAIARDVLSYPELPAEPRILARLVLGEALTTSWGWTDEDRSTFTELLGREDLSSSQRAEALIHLAGAQRIAEDMPGAGNLVRQALALADPPEKFAQVACPGFDLLAGEALVLGKLPEALAYADRAIDLAPQAGRGVLRSVQPHYVKGLAHLYADQLDKAEEIWKEGTRFNERSGTQWAASLFDYCFANVSLARGHLDDAETQLRSMIQASAEVTTAWFPTQVARDLARIALLRGDLRMVDEMIEHVRVSSNDLPNSQMNLLWLQGARAATSGDPATALEFWKVALDVAQQAGYDFHLRWLSPPFVQLAIKTKHQDEAERVAHDLATVSGRMGSETATAMATSTLALVESDAAMAEGAVRTLRDGQRPLDLALSLVNAALVYGSIDARASARFRSEAVTVYERHGALGEAQRLGSKRPRPSAKAARPSFGWESLTPTESRVVDLVTDGFTYRQVAEELFISRRTVESHVAKVFQKLGIASRGELAAEARRRTNR